MLLGLSATVAAESASAAALAKDAVVEDAEEVVVATDDDLVDDDDDDDDVSDEDVNVDCKVHVDHDDCKVQVVDQDVDDDALSTDDVEHDVDAVLCCSLFALLDIVVVEVVVVNDLSLDDPDADVLCKVLVEDESCTVLEVDL